VDIKQKTICESGLAMMSFMVIFAGKWQYFQRSCPSKLASSNAILFQGIIA